MVRKIPTEEEARDELIEQVYREVMPELTKGYPQHLGEFGFAPQCPPKEKDILRVVDKLIQKRLDERES